MKKLLLLLLAVFSIQFAKAAANLGIVVDNTTGCRMIVTVYAHDNTNNGCQYYMTTPVLSARDNFTATYTWAQLTTAGIGWQTTNGGLPATPDFNTIVVDAFRVEYNPGTGCSGFADVGPCTFWPSSSTFSAGCSCNGGNVPSVTFTDNGTDYIIKMIP